MKLMHLSDLHLGKIVNGFSMLEDQKYILAQILELARSQKPDGVLIAGDVYDKRVPAAEAVGVLDGFLTDLAQIAPVLLISGNHDSAERLAFGGRLMTAAGVYVSPVYDGTVRTVELADEFGPVQIHLLPFLKPVQVRRFFPEAEIANYTDAVRTALSHIDRGDGARHVLVTHQLVTGAALCDSEELSIGGSENVDAEVFEGFDYVALGHLHGPQRAGGDHIRYCGTPLKYSFSEEKHHKSVTMVTLGEKGSVQIDALPLSPLRDLKVIRGTYQELMARSYYQNTDLPESYLHIILTDEEDVPEALGRMRQVYPYIMKLTYDNTRTRDQQNPLDQRVDARKTPLELFRQLYEAQNNQPMSEQQDEFLARLIGAIWEEEA
jgi:exonuclease SbcD